ncbi:hypothetical protein UFOVP100_12 [uncultured Caudovirales phage]|uniref:Uncharacterized protein n=1 Tax=uncultured Caudovirales phage TaxID=2100421 RepID=A0A6J5L8N2_9CAUD|nr:hypothetical protein UFOVP100_12 [uncultured Caudovirales phage]
MTRYIKIEVNEENEITKICNHDKEFEELMCKDDKMNFLSWLDFAIRNQEELKLENKHCCPEWNKGYLDALLDMKGHIFCLPITME